MHLLDTDTLTHLYAGNTNVIARLNAVEDSEVGITIITKAEMLRGRIEYLSRYYLFPGSTWEYSLRGSASSYKAGGRAS